MRAKCEIVELAKVHAKDSDSGLSARPSISANTPSVSVLLHMTVPSRLVHSLHSVFEARR